MQQCDTPRADQISNEDAHSGLTELCLWMGQLLMDNGAESERVERTMRAAGATFGCSWSSVLVTYDALLITELTGTSHRTKLHRVRPRAVNMSLIEQISHLSHRLNKKELSAGELRTALERIERTPRHYSAPLTIVTVGLGCAAFSRLFQGDWGAFAATFAGTASAMWVRHYYARREPNRLIFVGVSALLAATVVGALQRLLAISETPSAAFVASALMLVPGVPAINAAQDMIKGHLGVAVPRAVEAALVILAGALGLMLSLKLTAVQL
jgi:uncharacterized membrane protein YjjP (DUF1212 family)